MEQRQPVEKAVPFGQAEHLAHPEARGQQSPMGDLREFRRARRAARVQQSRDVGSFGKRVPRYRVALSLAPQPLARKGLSSSDSRLGTECLRTCRLCWLQYNYKKKK